MPPGIIFQKEGRARAEHLQECLRSRRVCLEWSKQGGNSRDEIREGVEGEAQCRSWRASFAIVGPSVYFEKNEKLLQSFKHRVISSDLFGFWNF